MNFTISEYVPGQRPDVKLPSKELFFLLKEDGIRQLVSDHYELLKTSNIKELFPSNPVKFEKAKENSADFFIQVCGGPMYFNKHRGRPMLYKRHLPHKITAEGRKEWLKCYQKVLGKLDLPEDVLQSLWNYLDIFSIWMVNS